MLNQKGYLNQIALIQSECEPRSKPRGFQGAAFNRSPIRDRQNKINLSNMGATPTRSGTKVSLSPLRTRKCDNSINLRSTNNRKRIQADCTNHPGKTAKYIIQSEEETLLYCEKCAILLASQGFKVSKWGQIAIQDNPRKQEVDGFLNELDALINNLLSKHKAVDNISKKGIAEYQLEGEKIQTYYSQFYEIIDEHKRRVLEEMKLQYDTASHNIMQMNDTLDQAIQQSNSMKEDIRASLNSIILEAEESQYRPVMDLYKEKVRKYRAVLNRPIPQEQIRVRKVCFKDGSELCHTIAESISVEWENEKDSNEGNLEESVPACNQINPVECLESQEKIAKSSLREIGNLFSSFDQ